MVGIRGWSRERILYRYEVGSAFAVCGRFVSGDGLEHRMGDGFGGKKNR